MDVFVLGWKWVFKCMAVRRARVYLYPYSIYPILHRYPNQGVQGRQVKQKK